MPAASSLILAEGDHGYLGLVLTDAKYATVTATPFVPPTHPASLSIPKGTDQVQALNIWEIQKDAKNAYYE